MNKENDLDLRPSNKIPTADEMADITQKKLNNEIEKIFSKIIKSIEDAPKFSAIVTLSEKEQKFSEEIMKEMEVLGYKVSYEAGYYEDHPCGGYVCGKLKLDWTPKKKR